MTRNGYLIATITTALAATTAGQPVDSAHAGGLFVPGLGAQAMGRAGAFVAKADDASALHHNPAGLARSEGTVFYLGSNLLDYTLRFTRAGTYEDVPDADLPWEGQPYPTVENQARPAIGIGGMQALPLFAVTSDLKGAIPGLHIGAGVMVPNAYPVRDFGSDYQLEDPNQPPPPGRYDVVYQNAVTILPSVGAAYSIGDKLDIGARFSFGLASVEATSYTWAVPNFHEWAAEDGLFELSVKDNFVPGFGLGVLFRPTANLEIGASYSSALKIRAQGEGNTTLGSVAADPFDSGNVDRIIPPAAGACADGGQIGALKSCLDLNLPRTATVGVRWIVPNRARTGETADIELDVKWENWSSASDYRIIVDGQSEQTGFYIEESVIRHGFQDVLSVRLGGSYNLAIGDNALSIRAGVAHDTAAAPDSWTRLDIDGAARTTLALGAAFTGKRFRVDVGGGVVMQPDRTVAACNPANGSEGCEPGSETVPVDQRVNPDPVQPLSSEDRQFFSPFNGGDYASGYLMFGLGLSTWF